MIRDSNEQMYYAFHISRVIYFSLQVTIKNSNNLVIYVLVYENILMMKYQCSNTSRSDYYTLVDKMLCATQYSILCNQIKNAGE